MVRPDESIKSYLDGLFGLKGKRALCTGSTRGIGQEAALTLARAGADLILVQRDTKNLETKLLAEKLGSQCEIVECDLARESETTGLITKVTKECGLDFDIVVNCGGIQRRHKAEDFPDADWNEVQQVNLNAVFHITRDAGKHFITQNKPGRIINFASLLSFQGGFTVPAYAAAKHGVTGLTKAFSNEWAGKNIGVNAIAPGYIATDMNTALLSDSNRSAQILQRIPAGHWGKPEDFQTVMLFLTSFASTYVSGETVLVDGGWMGR